MINQKIRVLVIYVFLITVTSLSASHIVHTPRQKVLIGSNDLLTVIFLFLLKDAHPLRRAAVLERVCKKWYSFLREHIPVKEYRELALHFNQQWKYSYEGIGAPLVPKDAPEDVAYNTVYEQVDNILFDKYYHFDYIKEKNCTILQAFLKDPQFIVPEEFVRELVNKYSISYASVPEGAKSSLFQTIWYFIYHNPKLIEKLCIPYLAIQEGRIDLLNWSLMEISDINAPDARGQRLLFLYLSYFLEKKRSCIEIFEANCEGKWWKKEVTMQWRKMKMSDESRKFRFVLTTLLEQRADPFLESVVAIGEEGEMICKNSFALFAQEIYPKTQEAIARLYVGTNKK